MARKPVQSSFEATSKITLPRPHSREAENLKGLVKTVLLEITALEYQSGRWTEGPRRAQETSKYDENGNQTEVIFFAFNKRPKRKIANMFDSSGKETEGTIYKDKGILQLREVVSYVSMGDTGTLIEWAQYYSSGSLHTKYVSTFDRMGMETQRTVTDGPTGFGYQWTFAYNYDRTGRLREKVRTERSLPCCKNPLFSDQTETYDERGNLINVKHEILPDLVDLGPHIGVDTTTYFYKEFDSHGNWTKRIKREEDEEVQTEYRTITYHEGEPHDESAHSR